MKLSRIGQSIFNEFVQNVPYKIEFPLRENIRKYSKWKDSYTALIIIFTEYLTHEDIAEITREEGNETYFKLTDRGRRLKRYKTLKKLEKWEILEDKATAARYRKEIWWLGVLLLSAALGWLANDTVKLNRKTEQLQQSKIDTVISVKKTIAKDSILNHR